MDGTARIDTHIHLYDPAAGSFSWPEPGSVFYRKYGAADFMSAAEGQLMDGAVVIGCSLEPGQTEYMLKNLSGEDAVLAIIAHIGGGDVDYPARRAGYEQYPKYRGFRLPVAEAGGEAVRSSLACAREMGDVVEFLGSWRNSGGLEPLIRAHPDLTFIIEHYAGHIMDGGELPPEYLEYLSKMASYEMVHMKVSGALSLAANPPSPAPTSPEHYRAPFDACMAAFGPERLMFGSDWPVMRGEYRDAVAVTATLAGRYGRETADKVMGGNAKRVYRL